MTKKPSSRYLASALPLLILSAFAPVCARAQAPTILWSTNVGAQLFAVDAQTNVYAAVTGAVVRLSAAGQPLQTNTFCPLPGLAQRDAAGNIYFAGAFPLPCQFCQVTPIDFGGATLSNGLFYVAKYSAAGTLIWAKEFGPHMDTAMRRINATDFQLDYSGNFYVGFMWADSTVNFQSQVARFDGTGSNIWTMNLPNASQQNQSTVGSVRLGEGPGTNGYAAVYLPYALFNPSIQFWSFDQGGNPSSIASWSTGVNGNVDAWKYAHTILDMFGQVYNVEAGVLTKRSPAGAVIWTRAADPTQWTVAPDQYQGVHVGSDTGPLSRYDSDGNLVWTLPLASEVNAMVLDPHNNRFISLVDGTVARLGGETLSAPNVDTPPQSQTTLVGSNVLFSVAASGFTPLRYKWFFNGTLLTQATNSMLGLTGVTTTNAGLYAVAVSNIVGSVTSAPAQLRVKYVELFQGNQPMTNGNYFFASPPTLTILSAFSNGASFYTLDGSVPSFSSIHYTGPFTVSASATVRAIGYSADFTQSEEADPINVTVQTQHRLTAVATGGGSVTLEPPGGVYANTNHVTATAASTPGWSFLYWLGDASGSVSNLAVSMERDKTIEAVFGTTLSTTVSGNGVIELDPPGGTYQYGAVVRLTGLPQAGSYFGFWGNAVSGNNNPLYLTLTNPAPTVSSIFGTLGSGQVTLTVLISGAGKISVTPQANTYATGTMVTLTATAKGGQTFLHWSGDATGAQNPLTATLDQSKTITANFTGEPVLRVNRPGLEGLTSAGFRFTIVSAPLLAWQILSSSDLNTWTPLGTVTNTEGEAQFTDPAALGYAHYFYKVVPWP